ncbi:MAG TPA: DUF3459 domain-containing protein, partial [Bryobacteraceae bacterium]|nr:DUF3459 domain-containing protein [Bryobacteraceae bacterium]
VSPFRERPHGRKPANIPGWRFLGYLQNHDQIGNRALGDRSSHLLSRGKLMIGAALVMTAPFVPMLFEGEEWGASTPFLYFTQHEEDWLVHAVSDGRRKEFAAFGWTFDEVPDPQEYETFAQSKLKWNEIAGEPHASLLAWHKRLIQLRRSHRELSDGRLDRVQVRFDEEARWLSMERSPFIIACNFAENEQQLPLPGSCEVVLASADITLESRSASLPAESVAILRRN